MQEINGIVQISEFSKEIILLAERKYYSFGMKMTVNTTEMY